MKLFGREIFKRAASLPTASIGAPPQWLVDLLTGSSAAGPTVNDESAITLASVYTCNLILSQSIGSLSLRLYRNMPNGDVLPAPKEIESRVVTMRPSSLYTPYTLRSTMQFHLGLRGNAYARILRDPRTGRVNELRLLHPSFVRPFFSDDNLFYEISPNPAMGYSKHEIVYPDDVIHIAHMSSDGIMGRSPITVLRDTIGMSLSARDYASKILANQGILRGLLKSPAKLTQDQTDYARENFKKPMLEGGFPVLANGMEFQPITLKPADAEFINTAKLTKSDIAGAHRIPPHMIGDLDKATFSNIEQQSLEFIQHTLSPWCQNWEPELDRKILPSSMLGEFFYAFDMDSLLRGDTKSRAEYYVRARQWGWMSANEIRKRENLPYIEGGDTFLTPLNMVDVNADLLGTPSSDPQQNQPQNGN